MGRWAAIRLVRAHAEPLRDYASAVRGRSVCVSVGRVVPGLDSVQRPLLREVVGSREGIILGLGAACARISCCTRLCWPWLAMERPCEASGERDSYGIILWILLGPKHMILRNSYGDSCCSCMPVRQIDIIST